MNVCVLHGLRETTVRLQYALMDALGTAHVYKEFVIVIQDGLHMHVMNKVVHRHVQVTETACSVSVYVKLDMKA